MADAKRGGEKEKSAKAEKREGSACYKSRCFCIAPTIFSTKPVTSTVKTGPIASRRLLSMVRTYNRLPVTWTLYNSNLPLTKSNFQFLSDHFPQNFTLDNSNSRKLDLFSISLEGSSYRESTVTTLFNRADTMATKNRPVASLRPE